MNRSPVMVLLCACLLASAASADPISMPESVSHEPRAIANREPGHNRRLSPDRRPPVPAPVARPAPSKAGDCDIAGAIAGSMTQFINLVRGSDWACQNQFFNPPSDDLRDGLYTGSRLTAVVDALDQDLISGIRDNSQGTEALVIYLRAAYFVDFYQDDFSLPGGFTAQVDQLLSNHLSGDFHLPVDDDWGSVLAELVLLIDSADLAPSHLPAVEHLLGAFDRQWFDYPGMARSLNQALVVLFRGHSHDDFQSALIATPGVVYQLHTLLVDHEDLLGSDDAWLIINAGRELARFIQYSSFYDWLKPQLIGLFDRHPLGSAGDAMWLAMAEVVDWHDGANCADYGICDYKQRAIDEVLALHYQCGSDLMLRTQSMSAHRLPQVCDTLDEQSGRYHDVMASGYAPVADDHNDTLEINVFASSDDYSNYAGALFGIDTNNGGMYLEGDPAEPSNQARFIAYQAEWLQPEFAIWNLEHEFVHYLDGRYHMYGAFGDYPLDSGNSAVWWIEGGAEYLSLLQDNPAALDLAAGQRPSLAALLDNTYNDSTDRVYRWGYLAVRYMMEQRRARLDAMSELFRQGQYPQYTAWIDELLATPGIEADFSEWLDCLVEDCDDQEPPPPVEELIFADSFVNRVVWTECPGGDPFELQPGCETRESLSADESLWLWMRLPAEPSGPLRIELDQVQGSGRVLLSASTWPSESEHDLTRDLHEGQRAELTLIDPAAASDVFLRLQASDGHPLTTRVRVRP